MFKQFIVLITAVVLVISCKKEKTPEVVVANPTVSGPQQYGTPFSGMPNSADLVIYEVNLRAFSSAGDINGIIARLNEIKALGTTTIWLMPIYSQGVLNSVGSPYCVKDYTAVNTEYGNLEDLRHLTNQAHSLGMTVILDWVANHTSWDHSWITDHPDWYTHDAGGNITIPAGTNWSDVADLNFTNLDMQAEMIKAMKYWVLEANVDGFRCDYADGVPFDFWNSALTELKTIPNRELLFLAEGVRPDHYTAGFDLTYSWNFYTTTKNVWAGSNPSVFYTQNQTEYNSIPAGKQKIRFTTNHDESAWDASPMTLFNGKAGALAASIPTIFMGGVPLFYTGQEVGRASTTPFFTKSPINWSANLDMKQAYEKLMSIYTNSEAARRGTIQLYMNSNSVSSFKKTSGTSEILILVNVRSTATNYAIPTELQGTQWTNALTDTPATLGSSESLTGYGYSIYTKE
ncbi:MAG: alpha-amylase family glycosyl hydrolase [Crocinitomicaceae bacterium]